MDLKQAGDAHTSRQFGNKTLARGLEALVAVTESPDGLTVLELADLLGVHRSVAYRTLQTLVDFGLASVSGGVYRGGHRLAALAAAYLPVLRDLALPVMREVAQHSRLTIALFVLENDVPVAVQEVEPNVAGYHFTFRRGGGTPMDRGAAAYALLALGVPQPNELGQVTRARASGFAFSEGEVEPGAFAVAAPIWKSSPPACLLALAQTREGVAAFAGDLVAAAHRISEGLR